MRERKALLRQANDLGEPQAAGDHSQGNHSAADASAYGLVTADVRHTTARGGAQMLRLPRAWAVDLAELELGACDRVAILDIVDIDSPPQYWATLRTIRLRGFRLKRDHGPHSALVVRYWRRTRARAEKPAPPQTVPRQLSLWDEAGGTGR